MINPQSKRILFICLAFLIIATIIAYKIGETKGSLNICLDYAYRYLTARGFDLGADLPYIKSLISRSKGDFENFINGNLSNYTDCSQTAFC